MSWKKIEKKNCQVSMFPIFLGLHIFTSIIIKSGAQLRHQGIRHTQVFKNCIQNTHWHPRVPHSWRLLRQTHAGV